MIKILLLSIIIFLGLLNTLENTLLSLTSYDLWKININNNSQRRVFKIIQQLKEPKKNNNIYVFGGSGSREFFENDQLMSKKLGKNFYNCSVSSETPFDSLKLQSLLHTGDTLIYGIHAKSFYDNAYNYKQVKDGYYFGGAYYKYPLEFNKNDFSLLNIDDNNISILNKVSPIINTYMYLVKTYSLKTILWSDKNNTLPKQYHYQPPSLPISKLTKKLNIYFSKNKETKLQNLSLNFNLLESMIQLSQKRKVKFILMELPFSPIVNQYFKNDLPLYYDKLHKLLIKYPQVKFIPNTQLKPAQQDLFYDSLHLLQRGRDYYSDEVISLLRKYIL